MDELPNEILVLIFSFLEIRDCVAILDVSKKLKFLIEQCESKWKELSLREWEKMISGDIYLRVDYLEKAQCESGKEWKWFAKCFVDRLYYQFYGIFIGVKEKDRKNENGYFCININPSSISIGTYGAIGLNGYGKILWYNGESYEGYFLNGGANGFGTRVYRSLKYQGTWNKNQRLDGHGSITYTDGFTVEGIWEDGQPRFDIRHPSIRECIEKKVCTNTLSMRHPQFMILLFEKRYCENCWINCKGKKQFVYPWFNNPKKCKCEICK